MNGNNKIIQHIPFRYDYVIHELKTGCPFLMAKRNNRRKPENLFSRDII